MVAGPDHLVRQDNSSGRGEVRGEVRLTHTVPASTVERITGQNRRM